MPTPTFHLVLDPHSARHGARLLKKGKLWSKPKNPSGGRQWSGIYDARAICLSIFSATLLFVSTAPDFLFGGDEVLASPQQPTQISPHQSEMGNSVKCLSPDWAPQTPNWRSDVRDLSVNIVNYEIDHVEKDNIWTKVYTKIPSPFRLEELEDRSANDPAYHRRINIRLLARDCIVSYLIDPQRFSFNDEEKRMTNKLDIVFGPSLLTFLSTDGDRYHLMEFNTAGAHCCSFGWIVGLTSKSSVFVEKYDAGNYSWVYRNSDRKNPKDPHRVEVRDDNFSYFPGYYSRSAVAVIFLDIVEGAIFYSPKEIPNKEFGKNSKLVIAEILSRKSDPGYWPPKTGGVLNSMVFEYIPSLVFSGEFEKVSKYLQMVIEATEFPPSVVHETLIRMKEEVLDEDEYWLQICKREGYCSDFQKLIDEFKEN